MLEDDLCLTYLTNDSQALSIENHTVSMADIHQQPPKPVHHSEPFLMPNSYGAPYFYCCTITQTLFFSGLCSIPSKYIYKLFQAKFKALLFILLEGKIPQFHEYNKFTFRVLLPLQQLSSEMPAHQKLVHVVQKIYLAVVFSPHCSILTSGPGIIHPTV